MTKKEMFNELIRIVFYGDEPEHKDEILEMLTHEIELLEKRTTHKTPTKTQKANEELMEKMLNAFVYFDEPASISDFLKLDDFSEYNSQKISALMTKLVKEGKVERTVKGKKATFSRIEN